MSQSTLGLALERGFGSQTTLSGADYRPVVEELEEAIALSSMATPKQNKRLHIPVVRIHDAQVRIAEDGLLFIATKASGIVNVWQHYLLNSWGTSQTSFSLKKKKKSLICSFSLISTLLFRTRVQGHHPS